MAGVLLVTAETKWRRLGHPTRQPRFGQQTLHRGWLPANRL